MNIENGLKRYVGIKLPQGFLSRVVDTPSLSGRLMNAIIGPRRAGKTTFMIQTLNSLDLPESNKIFINCEDINFEGITSDELDEIEEAIFKIYSPDNKKDIYLFIDEIQNFPSWGRWLRTLFDENKYKITVSGSTSELSTHKVPSVLRGRALNTLILPFSFAEFLAFKQFVDYSEHMKVQDSGKLGSLFEQYLKYGGYPAIVAENSSNTKMQIIQELYEAVIQRDIIEKNKIRKTEVLRAFLNAALGSTCRELSIPAMLNWFKAKSMEMSKQTASDYISFAEEVFLFFKVYPFSLRPKERQVKPKLYLADSGFLTMVGEDASKRLENQIFVELIRRKMIIHYWKDQASGKEVDFVIGKDTADEIIQVAYNLNDPQTYKRETESIILASEKLHCTKLKIITMNEENSLKINGEKIEVIPAWKWLLNKDYS
jgi:hypothetical protein